MKFALVAVLSYIGRGLTDKARESLNLPANDMFRKPEQPVDTGKGLPWHRKMVGKSCGVKVFVLVLIAT